ncbi:MAG: tRNA (N6-threonylcarbamoyladenosine(37)-N6)-methyltransferase TrmO [Candidatus Lokiarchaeota archaeon]|nr:tRNA (N6-threonylcarbamoyladenosine(37)-N6)-methyltransferase TrmO [Candidatus Lokiarchaeota archaeon]
MQLKIIGKIITPYKDRSRVPRQFFESKTRGRIEIFDQYKEGLKDLENFSHIYVIYLFHKSKEYKLKVIPLFGKKYRGLFATRYFCRPNPIGLSIFKLLRIEDDILHVKGVDVLSGTPLLDIKPYVDIFDKLKDKNIERGWLKESYIEGSPDNIE